MKKYLFPFFGLFLALFGIDAFAVVPTTLTEVASAVDYTDIKSALYSIFSGLAFIALIVTGGGIVLSKLGLRR